MSAAREHTKTKFTINIFKKKRIESLQEINRKINRN